MEISEVISILAGCLGSCGLGSILTVKYAKRQALAEARSAENEATKAVQDVYQELIEDVKRDRADQKAYIAEIKNDRNHLRKDRDELRVENAKLKKVINTLTEETNDIKKEQARLGRRVEIMTPFICSRTDCAERAKATVKELNKKKSNQEESK